MIFVHIKLISTETTNSTGTVEIPDWTTANPYGTEKAINFFK